MTSPHSELPSSVTDCHILIGQLQEELRDSQSRVSHLEALLVEHQETVADQEKTIEHLSEDIKLLKRSLFGSRRERFEDPTQAFLFNVKPLDSKPQQDEPVEPLPARKKRTSKGRQRRVFPDFLPREEKRYPLSEEDIPEELLRHPDARRFFKKVGEQIELIPIQLKVVEEYQEVIALDRPNATTTMIAAQRPPSLIQSFAGTSLLAYLTVSRFADHLPYYRQENILARSGLHIDRSTQWRWMRRLAMGVTPLVDLMWERARQSQVIAMDETPVRELGGPKTTLKGYLWCGVGDADHPYDCFFYSSDRRSVRRNVSEWVSRLLAVRCLHRLRTDWQTVARSDEVKLLGARSSQVRGMPSPGEDRTNTYGPSILSPAL